MPRKGFWRELAQAAAEGTRDGVGAYVRSGGKASAGLSEMLARSNAQRRLTAKDKQQLARQLRVGHATLRLRATAKVFLLFTRM